MQRITRHRKTALAAAALAVAAVWLLPGMVAPRHEVLALPAVQDAADAEDAQMDEALKKFGYVSGQACQCRAAGPDRTQHERQALEIATGVLRLFGSDRAFYYAAAFGAGVSNELDAAACPEVVKQYDAMLAKVKVLANR